MPQSLAKILIHVVFSTKDRQLLIDKTIEPQLHAYMAALFGDLDSPALLIGGRADHIHALASLSRSHALSDVLKKVKGESSKWIKSKGAIYRGFYWQAGYGAFSVSESGVAKVVKYIREQDIHHAQSSFKAEMRTLYRAHRIEFDEKYCWD